VGVHEIAVLVHVAMPTSGSVKVLVVVVPVVVVVLMGVLHNVMVVLVKVGRAQRQRHTRRGDQHRRDLHGVDGVTDHDPGKHGTDERCGR
jgi:hypothetical protein